MHDDARPEVARSDAGNLHVFVRMVDDSIQYRRFVSDPHHQPLSDVPHWTPWSSVTGIAAASDPTTQTLRGLEVYVLGNDSAIWAAKNA